MVNAWVLLAEETCRQMIQDANWEAEEGFYFEERQQKQKLG